MSAKARRPRRRPREISERDYMPRWVMRLLIALAVLLVLWFVGPLIVVYLLQLFS
jgi:hypothetical protein